MDKKGLISIILLFSFSFLLAHNIIPHHHHEDVLEINRHEHHHHDSEKHHHKKEHEKKSERHDNENEPISFYSHGNFLFTHAETSEILTHRKNSKKLQAIPIVILFTTKENLYKQLKIPIESRLSYNYNENLIQPSSCSYSYRGPPLIS